MDVDGNEFWQFDDLPQVFIDSHGRPSNCINEDDYDYALELRPGTDYVFAMLISTFIVCAFI